MREKTIFFFYLTLICVIVFNTAVNADVPKLISYQGRVLDSKTGEPVPDGTYDFTFRLYGSEDTDYAFWTETHYNVQVSNGLYNVMLGSVSEFDNIDFSNQYWLGVQVGIEPEMSPRYQLSASPYALNIANNIITTEKIQDGSITNDDLHGRITYAEITDENGEYQFTLSKHNPKLQFVGQGYADVDFDDANQAIIIDVGSNGNGGKGSE